MACYISQSRPVREIEIEDRCEMAKQFMCHDASISFWNFRFHKLFTVIRYQYVHWKLRLFLSVFKERGWWDIAWKIRKTWIELLHFAEIRPFFKAFPPTFPIQLHTKNIWGTGMKEDGVALKPGDKSWLRALVLWVRRMRLLRECEIRLLPSTESWNTLRIYMWCTLTN